MTFYLIYPWSYSVLRILQGLFMYEKKNVHYTYFIFFGTQGSTFSSLSSLQNDSHFNL